MEFKDFSKLIHARFDQMAATGQLFVVKLDKECMWNKYLDAFPPEHNKIFKERREYDCQCCKHFMRDIGNVVIIKDGKLETVWDVKISGYFGDVARIMDEYVKNHNVADAFSAISHRLGNKTTLQQLENGAVHTWNHFYADVPKAFVGITPKTLGSIRTAKEVFKRGLEEITIDAVNTVLELIGQNSLYRGTEFKKDIENFRKLKVAYDKDSSDIFCWLNANKPGAYIKNNVIGTLLIDLSEGVDLDKAVGSYEAKVAPSNYKRPTALITEGMIKAAMNTVQELGIEDALYRRFAVLSDISVNDVLFVDRSVSEVMQDSLMGSLMKEVKAPVQDFSKVEDISIEAFLKNVVPNIDSLEIMVENNHIGNFMTLVAPKFTGSNILKWNNNFTWSYNGNVTDSLKQRVAELGGRVDGVLRFTHTWNYDGQNQSLMDLHVFMPHCGYNGFLGREEIHNNYPNHQRVGWNHRKESRSGGVQDVDFVEPPNDRVPVENITFPNLKDMPEGKYIFKIHNWRHRTPCNSGFKAEIELGGELHQYEHPEPLKHHQWITVANAVLKDGKFTIEHVLKPGSQPKDVWNIKTCQFHKVSLLTISPNHWGDQAIGNKHFFFIIEDCKTDESPRGFFNEYLDSKFDKHRKVFEVLGNKTKCEMSETQVSGLGFSSTNKASVVCKVRGTFNRTLRIQF